MLMPNKTPDKSEGAVKADQSKPRYDLMMPEATDMLARVFAYGVQKYGMERNCELGFAYGRLFAAACRHMWAFWRGQENDPESGLPHLAHAEWNIHMLLTQTIRKTGKDTRWQYNEAEQTQTDKQ